MRMFVTLRGFRSLLSFVIAREEVKTILQELIWNKIRSIKSWWVINQLLILLLKSVVVVIVKYIGVKMWHIHMYTIHRSIQYIHSELYLGSDYITLALEWHCGMGHPVMSHCCQHKIWITVMSIKGNETFLSGIKLLSTSVPFLFSGLCVKLNCFLILHYVKQRI